MSGQMDFAEQQDLSHCRKQTKRERFLVEMDTVVPWARLIALIGPHYSRGGSGRRPIPLERMLRIHFLQQWYAYSIPAWKKPSMKSRCCGNSWASTWAETWFLMKRLFSINSGACWNVRIWLRPPSPRCRRSYGRKVCCSPKARW